MSTYMVNKFEIVNPVLFGKYVAAVMPIIASHHGEVVVCDTDARLLEGANAGMNVVIVFPTAADAMDFYESPEYQRVKALRLSSTKNTTFGLAEPYVSSGDSQIPIIASQLVGRDFNNRHQPAEKCRF